MQRCRPLRLLPAGATAPDAPCALIRSAHPCTRPLRGGHPDAEYYRFPTTPTVRNMIRLPYAAAYSTAIYEGCAGNAGCFRPLTSVRIDARRWKIGFCWAKPDGQHPSMCHPRAACLPAHETPAPAYGRLRREDLRRTPLSALCAFRRRLLFSGTSFRGTAITVPWLNVPVLTLWRLCPTADLQCRMPGFAWQAAEEHWALSIVPRAPEAGTPAPSNLYFTEEGCIGVLYKLRLCRKATAFTRFDTVQV